MRHKKTLRFNRLPEIDLPTFSTQKTLIVSNLFLIYFKLYSEISWSLDSKGSSRKG